MNTRLKGVQGLVDFFLREPFEGFRIYQPLNIRLHRLPAGQVRRAKSCNANADNDCCDECQKGN